MEMVASPRVRDAFDLSKEPESARERYGKFCENFLLDKRLFAEAGPSQYPDQDGRGTDVPFEVEVQRARRLLVGELLEASTDPRGDRGVFGRNRHANGLRQRLGFRIGTIRMS